MGCVLRLRQNADSILWINGLLSISVCSRWLKTSGDDCPNCNEKATRRDVRLHYVARLKAVDTAEKDRAVGDLEKFKCQLRTLELDHTTLKVTNAMQREEIDKVTIL